VELGVKEVERVRLEEQRQQRARVCPGRKPPKTAVKRPARPCKIAMQNRFAMENPKER
jgi:hypothetical protein